ncbi:MAG: SIMPL domain-containing protein [Spirulinaceae cyanobacterium SM2_1_0]|nr:SIMPL domain-containing protein [Spirulinaceae cyanobacterium SM2_1_0]
MIHSLIHPRTTALACGLALFSGLLPLSARAQEALERTLTVTGVGEVAVETTITRIQLGVEVRGATAAEVQAAVAERTTAVVDLLRSRAVERLQTTGIRLQPDYTFENRQRRLVGYVGTNSVAFQVPTPAAGEVIDATIRAGATQIDGINFLADEAAITTAEQAALREATADARQQADVVLDSLGLSAQEIVRIHINDNQTAPLPRMQNAMLESAPADTPVIGGQQLVQASVTLEIGY